MIDSRYTDKIPQNATEWRLKNGITRIMAIVALGFLHCVTSFGNTLSCKFYGISSEIQTFSMS